MSDPSSAPINGGQAVPPSSSSSSDDDEPELQLEPEPEPEAFDYGSIAEVVAHLQLTIDPAELLDVQVELPSWLHHAMENHLVPVDANTPADPNFAAVAGTFWTKVSSADAFLQALAASGTAIQSHAGAGPPVLHLFVMPSIPLHDAHRIHEMAQGREALSVQAAISIVNPGGLASKVAAFDASSGLLADLATTRHAAEQELAHLTEFAAAQQEESQYTEQLYQQLKTAYRNLGNENERVNQEYLDMLTAAARHFVARELAQVAERARVTMADQVQKLASKAEELEGAIQSPSFIGATGPHIAGGGHN